MNESQQRPGLIERLRGMSMSNWATVVAAVISAIAAVVAGALSLLYHR